MTCAEGEPVHDAHAAGRPRRVLLTTDTVGGVQSYTLSLAKALGRRGFTVAIATMGGGLPPVVRNELRTNRRVEVFESCFRLEWMDHPWQDIERASEWLLGIEQRFRPDIVHLGQYCFGALPWTVPSVVVAHSCVLSWWRAVHGERAPSRYAEYRKRVEQGLRGASAVVAPTRWMLDSLHENYGWAPRPGGHDQVIPNGCDPEEFTPGHKEPFVLCAGRLWDLGKNVAALDRAASRLAWPVRIAGSQHAPEHGHGIAGLEHARPLGALSRNEMRSHYARASIYALPARYEPFGLSVLEAALSECALILGDIPSLKEIWGDSAAYVAPGDVEALRAELTGFIRDPSRRESLGKAARKRAHEFTTDAMVGRYMSLYQELARSTAASARRQVCA